MFRTGRNNGVRQGKWKYLKAKAHFHGYAVENDREKVEELYDLEADLGETTNLAHENPEVVMRLLALIEQARDALGAALTGREGRNIRPPGRVTSPS